MVGVAPSIGKLGATPRHIGWQASGLLRGERPVAIRGRNSRYLSESSCRPLNEDAWLMHTSRAFPRKKRCGSSSMVLGHEGCDRYFEAQ